MEGGDVASMNAKPIAVLLAAVLGLQLYGLIRLEGMENEMESFRRAQENQTTEVHRRLEEMRSQLWTLGDGERWYAVKRTDILPDDSCQTAEARVEWELRQWTPGGSLRFLYRTDADTYWQEAEIVELGGASYAASFPIMAPPVLDWDVAVSGSRVIEDPERYRPDTRADRPEVDRLVAYQIVTEGSGESRSSGALPLVLSGYSIPAKIDVRTDVSGSYSVTLATGFAENRCTTIEGAEVRVYRGGSLVQTVPLERNVPPMFRAEWRSREQPHRLEIVIRYAGQEEVIPVDL